MLVKYSFQLFARCPTDSEPDVYGVTIESSRMILAEHILSVATRIGNSTTHLAQEAITVQLAREFAAKVTTIGSHYGVRTECVA